jgi:hypothetical protein
MSLLTAVVGGNYSQFTANNTSVGVRVVVYTLAPIAILLGLWSRVRFVTHSRSLRFLTRAHARYAGGVFMSPFALGCQR